MKKLIIFLNSLLSISQMNAGVSYDTLVTTPEGTKEIQFLNIGDKIISLDNNFSQEQRSVLTVEKVNIKSYIEITTEDGALIKVSPDQRLFVPQKWVPADSLSLGDVLLSKDHKFIRIQSICLKEEPLTLHFITLDGYKNFLVTNNGILVHNGLFAAAIGYTLTKTVCYGIAAAGISALATTGGGLLGIGTHVFTTIATLPAGPGTTLVASVITGAGLTEEAVLTTTAVATAAGGLAETVAMVETASCLVSNALLACPFLP